MDFVTLPHGLFLFYGALVLSCGVTFGVIVGRNWKRRAALSDPTPPEILQRRMLQLEEELELTRADLQRLLDDRDFMRELRPPRPSASAA